jgi:hypothetical protein
MISPNVTVYFGLYPNSYVCQLQVDYGFNMILIVYLIEFGTVKATMTANHCVDKIVLQVQSVR